MDLVIQALLRSPLLLLFAVAALGYAVGQIRIAGTSLGVAAVLFAGLAVGALHPDLQLPELVYQFGLVLFVYTVGLSSGRQFFASFRREGLRDNLFVVAMIGLAAVLSLLAGRLLALAPTLTGGLFAGSLTNTPALAGVLEYVQGYAAPELLDRMLAEPVVAYSITYPMGVVGMILAVILIQRLWKIDYAEEARRLRIPGAASQRLENRTITVTRPEVVGEPISRLVARYRWDVIFGRVHHDGQISLAGGETRLALGDLVSIIGKPEDLDAVTAVLGQESDRRLELDRAEFDFRRIFVSNPEIAGRRLRDLNLPRQYGALVTRVRRGDIEMLAHADTVLELGDRVRVVARPENMAAVSNFFGDSYRAVSEVDILTLTLGLVVGLLVGMVPIPLPGGVPITLGLAGGPLVVALILGALERTGPLVWTLPYSANMTLRQMGLILFLAGIGTRAGYLFITTLTEGNGLAIFVAGAVITGVTALATLWIGHRLLKIPLGVLVGMLAGLQTQPAILAFALEQTGNELPNVGYAAVYPVALIAKILLAQLLLVILL